MSNNLKTFLTVEPTLNLAIIDVWSLADTNNLHKDDVVIDLLNACAKKGETLILKGAFFDRDELTLVHKGKLVKESVESVITKFKGRF